MPVADRRALTATALDGVRRVVRALRLAAGSTEQATGLSAAQLFVLQAVHAHPGRSLTAIAAQTLTDRTSVRAVVDRLVARGLVERRPSAVDRRSVALVATPAADAVLAHAPHPPTRRLLDGLDALGEGDLRALARGVEALTRAMGLEGEPAGMLFSERGSAGTGDGANGANGADGGVNGRADGEAARADAPRGRTRSAARARPHR